MKEIKDIGDDQIRVIGENTGEKPRKVSMWFMMLIVLAVTILVIFIYVAVCFKTEPTVSTKGDEPFYFEPIVELDTTVDTDRLGADVDSLLSGYVEIKDTVINDIPLHIYIPHNAEMTLHVGKVDKMDESIVFAAQAADIRADNGGIVGAFVLKGEPMAWGRSKKGFCAVIDGKISIGMAESTLLFEEATERDGYFFRQYPLVHDGQLVDNAPKGKAVRRAICDRKGEVFMVQSDSRESFHDFAQALVDVGVEQAINLVGGSYAYGWAVDESGSERDFGSYYTMEKNILENTTFIIWRKTR